MSLSMPFAWSGRQLAHRPEGEVWVGVRTPGTELPERALRIRDAVAEAGAREVEAAIQSDSRALGLHDPDLVAYLETAWSEWEAAGLTREPGADRVVPYLFAHPGLLGSLPARVPAAAGARAGAFAYDTMTLIGPGTWEAARAALDVALCATDLVVDGADAAYALCRPPGHHATRNAFGGSCYLNNAAAAAARLLEEFGAPVALLDIDAHHGNGAQQIFYERADVLTGSVHVDPGAGWFPHFVGFAAERGGGDGAGANLNLPLAPGSGDGPWLEGVARLAAWAREAGARALVVALGVDAAGGDPESPLEVTPDGFAAAGAELGRLAIPTVVVQEGGYDLGSIGALVVAALSGIERGLPR